MLISRHSASTLLTHAKHFPAIMVNGPRQVGKTTLIEETIIKPRKGKITQVSFDDPITLNRALEERGRFFLDYPPPIFIDEVQYAPSLFPYIKIIADKEKKPGLFFLSGSQQFSLMKGVSESLAGRVGIIDLFGLSLREIENHSYNLPFSPNTEFFSGYKKPMQASYKKLWDIIWRGSMPRLHADSNFPHSSYYGSYLRTYIERDVRSIVNIGDEQKFVSFIRCVAARTAQLLNLSNLAKDAGISRASAERWLSILNSAGLIFLLRPFHVNISKREVKTPKLYFMDTGLAAYITGWGNSDVLSKGAMSGAFFETFIISEIIKSYTNQGIQPPLFYYRNKEQKEIDLLIWRNGHLHPIEIKMTANPDKKDISSFNVLNDLPSPYKRGEGGIICCYHELISLGEKDRVIPFGYL